MTMFISGFLLGVVGTIVAIALDNMKTPETKRYDAELYARLIRNKSLRAR